MAEIQNISIELVKVHPNNVRKTYNDIEEFAESKNTEGGGTYSNQPAPAPQQNDGGFMSVDEDSELPFT